MDSLHRKFQWRSYVAANRLPAHVTNCRTAWIHYETVGWIDDRGDKRAFADAADATAFRKCRQLDVHAYAQHHANSGVTPQSAVAHYLAHDCADEHLAAPTVECTATDLAPAIMAAWSADWTAEHEKNTVLVVMPTYNRSAQIAERIRQMKAQRHPSWLMLVVDDGSSLEHERAFRALCEEYANDRRVWFYRNHRNRHVAYSLNRGIRLLHALPAIAFFTWISDDNVYHDTFLAELVAGNRGFKSTAYVSEVPKVGATLVDVQYTHDNILTEFAGCAASMWTADAVRKVGLYDEDIKGCEDYDYLIRTLQGGVATSHSSVPTVTYVFDGSAYSRRRTEEVRCVTQYMLERHANQAGAAPPPSREPDPKEKEPTPPPTSMAGGKVTAGPEAPLESSPREAPSSPQAPSNPQATAVAAWNTSPPRFGPRPVSKAKAKRRNGRRWRRRQRQRSVRRHNHQRRKQQRRVQRRRCDNQPPPRGNARLCADRRAGPRSTLPKILHVYWDGSPFSPLNLLTILSFNAHNAGWAIFLHQPASRTVAKTWRGGENKEPYRGRCWLAEAKRIPNVTPRLVDFGAIGFDEEASEVIKSDYLRYYALHTWGGVWSDLDILYLRPLDVSLVGLRHASITLFRHEDDRRSYTPVGWLAALPGGALLNHVLERANRHYDATDYQCLGAHLWDTLFPTAASMTALDPGARILPVDHYIPLHWDEVQRLLEEKEKETHVEFTPHTFGLHWFNGLNMMKQYATTLDARLQAPEPFAPRNQLDALVEAYVRTLALLACRPPG